jgi:hypothetical protein
MTTAIVIGLLFVVALIGLELLWDWRRSGRIFCTPIPRRYRGTETQEEEWLERFGHQKQAVIDAVLTSFCEAFSFNPDSRYVFGPDDQVMEVYRACYPRWKLWLAADSMEIETLMMDLEKRFGIESGVWRADICLGKLVDIADRSSCAAE